MVDDALDGEGEENPTLYDNETKRAWPLFSDTGQLIFRDMLRADASTTWASIGLYATQVMADIDAIQIA